MSDARPSAWVPDLTGSRKIHVVAAGGAAMSAVSVILARMGHTVSGTDQADSATMATLRAEGVRVGVGHDAHWVAGVDLVAVSAAVKPGNAELDAARAAGIPVATRGDMMEAIAAGKRTVAVSGTAGKTTTSAMAAFVAERLGHDPSFIVGGLVPQLGSGVAWRPGPWFVVEADESDGSFLRFRAEHVVVNNVEEDHLDHWVTMRALEGALVAFVEQASGVRIVGVDDPGARRLVRSVGRAAVSTFGTGGDADYRIVDWASRGLGSQFAIVGPGGARVPVSLELPGLHNARNATAVFALADRLGWGAEVTADALGEFRGVGRRFEHRGSARGVTFVDDYAHLPSKVAAAVAGAGAGPWRRIVAVFQPHRYTRTQALAEEFGRSFGGAQVVVVTDVYAAGQAPIPGVTGRLVADAVARCAPDTEVVYVESRAELRRELESVLRAGDLCLTMNAGDLTTLPDEMLASPWAAGHGPAAGRDEP